jgi:hypothetical protein
MEGIWLSKTLGKSSPVESTLMKSIFGGSLTGGATSDTDGDLIISKTAVGCSAGEFFAKDSLCPLL